MLSARHASPGPCELGPENPPSGPDRGGGASKRASRPRACTHGLGSGITLRKAPLSPRPRLGPAASLQGHGSPGSASDSSRRSHGLCSHVAHLSGPAAPLRARALPPGPSTHRQPCQAQRAGGKLQEGPCAGQHRTAANSALLGSRRPSPPTSSLLPKEEWGAGGLRKKQRDVSALPDLEGGRPRPSLQGSPFWST